MDYIAKAKKVFEIEISQILAVASRLDAAFIDAVDAIKSAVSRSGKVVVMGVGKSGHIGDKIAATLTSTGCPAVVLNSLNALHGDLGIVADGDIVLTLSYSGQTDELTNILPALRRFDITLIAITGNPDSALGRAANHVLNAGISQEACPLNLAPTSSTTAMLVLGDALAMVLLEARGFNKDDFAKFHPGGQLGRALLLKVSEIMRGADRLPVVAPGTLIVDVVRAMTRCRSGAAVIIDADGRIAGVFTHGDFARHFPSTPGIGTVAVEELMTRNPVRIRSDKLAVDVLHVLQTHAIDDLPVVDEDDRPLGIVDSQDLSRHKLL
jgi:arabinose-5-phosphate isomerase